jgi:FkbM family methyltransferase
MPEFRWGRIQLEVPEDGFFVPYATFVVDEYYFLDVGPNDVVIDAGAYVGDFTVKAAERARLVIAVEPDPGSVELLRRNVRGLGNVVVAEAALGEGPGVSEMEGSGVSARVEPGRGDRVKVVALDDLMEELGVEPTLLKMDIEGMECAALRGGLRSLRSVRRAVMEVHGPQNVEECPRVLEAQGFRTALIGARELFPRVLRNIISHPMAFLSYERKTGFFATKSAVRYLAGRGSGIPALDTSTIRLLRAWRSARRPPRGCAHREAAPSPRGESTLPAEFRRPS